jgi:hypothetical protein
MEMVNVKFQTMVTLEIKENEIDKKLGSFSSACNVLYLMMYNKDTSINGYFLFHIEKC